MKDPEFDKAYRNARRAVFSQSVGRLLQAVRAVAQWSDNPASLVGSISDDDE